MIFIYIAIFLSSAACLYHVIEFIENGKARHGGAAVWIFLITVMVAVGAYDITLKQLPIESSDDNLQQQAIEQMTFEDSVLTYIMELNIKHPNVVLKQAKIESGNFKSKVFKENNNMFGFKKAYKRANTQISVNRGYATYNSWQECIIDYALYQTYSAKNLSRDEYVEFLGCNYAEDPNYKNLIK